MNKLLPLMVILLSLSGCQTTQTMFPPAHKVMLTGDTLVFDAIITGETVLEAIRIARESDKPVKTLRITSPGGEIASGIELGYFVKENNLDVEVSRLCFSACANYVITAANKVTIKKDALVGWHGGARQSDELWKQSVNPKDHEELLKYINRLRAKETIFFSRIDVDPNITVYGQTSLKRCQSSETTDGWYYSLSDLNKMGVTNVEVQGELAASAEYMGETVHSCLMPSIEQS